eukprot:TRINITY_DN22273_c0_g1_i1.p1 TRINITY_DN22273_c0_g1~~TRINITY_DN22273_c0_g1_i1.p1  ORF type:complete len:410 (-),score=89.46 TRINITY_DN22273_c0_g1_i1:29-1234(-)
MSNVRGLGDLSSRPAGGPGGPGGGGPGGPAGGVAGGQPQILGPSEMCQQWKSTCPLVTRWVVYLSIPLAILSLFARTLTLMFGNCPASTFAHFQLYRLLTHTFFDASLISVLFAAYSFNDVGKKVEGVRGSVFLIVSMFQLDLIIQLLFSVVVTLLRMLVPSFSLYGTCSTGLWPVVFCFMVYEAQTDVVPTKQFMCFPCDIPTKLYPWILAAIFQVLFYQSFAFDIISGLVIGWVFWKISFLQLSIATATKWESNCFFKRIAGLQGFVSVSATGVSYIGGSPVAQEGGSSWNFPSVGGGSGDEEAPARPSLSSKTGGHTLGSGSSSAARAGLKPGGNQILAQKYASKMQQQEPQLASPSTDEVKIAQLMSLGYTREDAIGALKESGGDVRRAQQFLSGGL